MVVKESEAPQPADETVAEDCNSGKAPAELPSAQQNGDGSEVKPKARPAWPLAKPTEGIWQITLDGKENWAEAHVSRDNAYIQRTGARKHTHLEITGDGSDDSPFQIGTAKLIE